MNERTTVLLPQTQKLLVQMGEQFRLARLRRKLSMEVIAKRASVSRATLWKIEKGCPTVAIGSYAAVLVALGLQQDLLKLAEDDVVGHTYQDFDLPIKVRAPKR